MQTKIIVRTDREIKTALSNAKPGHTIEIASGEYAGGLYAQNLFGEAKRPIVLRAQDAKQPPVFRGGNTGLQISRARHIELSDLRFVGGRYNGVNVDDGGDYDKSTSAQHIVLRNIQVSEVTQSGNHDGIKLSGLRDFLVEDCKLSRWGGSGVDMVGCHRGAIVGCTFQNGGSNGVQIKGGSSDVAVRDCRFDEGGARGVNIGGTTGLEFFRPRVTTMPPNGRHEAKRIVVENCTFVRAEAPFAFVGSVDCIARQNTIYRPLAWAVRILQENRNPGFLMCRDGLMQRNLIVFRAGDGWRSGGFNNSEGPLLDTFRFEQNWWYCEDEPAKSKPRLPVMETKAVHGRDPRATFDKATGLVTVGDEDARPYGAQSQKSPMRPTPKLG